MLTYGEFLHISVGSFLGSFLGIFWGVFAFNAACHARADATFFIFPLPLGVPLAGIEPASES